VFHRAFFFYKKKKPRKKEKTWRAIIKSSVLRRFSSFSWKRCGGGKIKRKVIRLAGKTLVVSLPSKWASKFNVKKGDEIDIEEGENKLIITPQSELVQEKGQVDISGLEPMIKRVLGAFYKGGYDEVEVRFSSPEELETAQDVIREEFIGYEVVYSGKNSILVRNISKIEYGEYDNIQRRMFMVILTMAKESLEAIKKNDANWLKSIAFMDKDVNKYAVFCRRILNKKGYSLFKKTPPIYFIVEQLEKIADSYRDICKSARIKTLDKDIERIYAEINSFLNDFYELFYKFDMKRIADFGKKYYALKEKMEGLIKRKKETGILLHLQSILENVFDMNGALLIARL